MLHVIKLSFSKLSLSSITIIPRCFSKISVQLPICFLKNLFCFSGKANFRQIEKKILDSIIGPGRYDSRIRPHGINNTGKFLGLIFRIHLKSHLRQYIPVFQVPFFGIRTTVYIKWVKMYSLFSQTRNLYKKNWKT